METAAEMRAHDKLERYLGEQGYATYARIWHNFQLNITNDPTVIGYMVPGKNRIVLNGKLDMKNISTVVRHEILHHYLQHELRLLKHVAENKGLDFSLLQDADVRKLKDYIYMDNLYNIAADYEISNVGYTDEDKVLTRNVILDGEIISCLVTEDDHPDWVDWSLEDMYDELTIGKDDFVNKLEQMMQVMLEVNTSGNSSESDEEGSGSGKNSKDQSQSNSNGKMIKGKMADGPGASDNSSSEPNENGNNGSGNTTGRSPRIGDRGNPDIQAAEALARAAAAVVDDMGNELEDEDIQDMIDAINESRDAIKKGHENEAADKLVELEQAFDNAGVLDKLKKETKKVNEINIDKAAEKRAEREIERYKNSGIYRFKMSFNNFLKKYCGEDREGTWRKFNKTYVGSNIIKQGKTIDESDVPTVNIYFDHSGSWDSDKITIGENAMAQMHEYVRKGQLKANTYYFSETVEYDKFSKNLFGGTLGTPIMDHISKTKPDNVIIMTDSDIEDIQEDTEVPGAVWLLFKGGVSSNLQDHIKGKRETHSYEL